MSCCCGDSVCSHAVLAEAIREASNLTDHERVAILKVLGRDELLRREQEIKVIHLKTELQNLRRKGALRPSYDWENAEPDLERSCGRCRVELGRVINRGAYCRACRLKVCKGCREYSFRTTDWVCIICHKQMEIQATSGEWMNEFVRRPSRRRDNRVYVPAADIIKRTIRRSWTISNPTSWNLIRNSIQMRPYNSLPRNQDLKNYPSLQHGHKGMSETNIKSNKKNSTPRRTHSEDVYHERKTCEKCPTSPRMNPLILYAPKNRKCWKKKSKSEGVSDDVKVTEKRVSFDNNPKNLEDLTPKSPKNIFNSFTRVITPPETNAIRMNSTQFQVKEEIDTNFTSTSSETSDSFSFDVKAYQPIELCDIEPISGTVFRKVTVRRRRQDMRKMRAVDSGWRRNESDILDILIPEGDDYKLVFISSDSSSKEEDIDDNDSSSTASSHPIDECDWDYFEPGATAVNEQLINLNSPFNSPKLYRKELIGGTPIDCKQKGKEEDENRKHMDEIMVKCNNENQVPCQNCGGAMQFIPIPVPVPIPVPITILQQNDIMQFNETISRFRIPRNLTPFLNSTAYMWSLIGNKTQYQTQFSDNNKAESETSQQIVVTETLTNDEMDERTTTTTTTTLLKKSNSYENIYLISEINNEDSSSSSEDTEEYEKNCVNRVYNINSRDGRESDDALTSSDLNSSDDDDDEVSRTSLRDYMTSSCSFIDTDSEDNSDKSDKGKFSKIFVVNKNDTDNCESDNSDDEIDDFDATVVLQNIKYFDEEDRENMTNDEISDKNENSLLNEDCTDRKIDELRSVNSVNNNIEKEVVELSTTSSSSSSLVCSPGVLVTCDPTDVNVRHGASARYTSLVMITQDSSTVSSSSSSSPTSSYLQQVSVVTSNTTTFVNDNDVVVQHTNSQNDNKNKVEDNVMDHQVNPENVTIITGSETLSAFEEGLADDDSWVENISNDEDDFGPSSITEESSSGEEVTLTCSIAVDNEDALRGYHRTAIDFTLHTILEESCEESEVDQPKFIRKSQLEPTTDLEKYFFFSLGEGNLPSINTNREDAFSETSSVYSEVLDSLSVPEEEKSLQNEEISELASSRLEKYFLSGFMGFKERKDSDGSVGSDSEGRPSPEQRRKRLVRARGTGRSHSSSLDNLLSNPDFSNEQNESNVSENSSSSDSDIFDETLTFDKVDGQFDTVKRKKNKKKNNEDIKSLETTREVEEDVSGDDGTEGNKIPLPTEIITTNLVNNKNQQQSRDSGFIGSCDDLIKEQRDNPNETTKNDSRNDLEKIEEKKEEKFIPNQFPPTTTLTRKDSFNNWSSDEETNLMMCKMRQFFKNMIANSQSSKPNTPNSNRKITNFPSPIPRLRRCKPPQLVYFENELTRLMKTVPGIREDQVREIVEYLSSEDTWSDSYDSSDYTSSDLEGTISKKVLQEQISDSCKEIIEKFDNVEGEEEVEGEVIDEKLGINKETAFVYQKLVASFKKIASGDSEYVQNSPSNSPPLIERVMHHIGSRLVALMYEVSSGDSHSSNSPKARHYHKRLHQKYSTTSSTTDDDTNSETNTQDTLSNLETNFCYSNLSRSKSHDLLMSEIKNSHRTSSGDTIEEREISDCERFSWRGSFESALLATDSRNKLSIIGSEGSASALAIAAKRRSAGDLIFSNKSLSREQLDRVRSCGSISGANSEDKLWVSSNTRPNRRRSSVPDASRGSGDSADGEDDDDEEINTRNLQSSATNSLPRLPTNALTTSNIIHKAQSHHFLPQNAKSARYRPPGFIRLPIVPKRAVSAPGLQPSHPRRGRRSQQFLSSDDVVISEAHSSPTFGSKSENKSATPSPKISKSRSGTLSGTNTEWQHAEEDIDRLMAMQGRSSLSSLGLRSDSMASVYSGAGEGRYGTVTVKGQVEFGLQYNYKAGCLEIHVKQCKDIAAVDVKRNRSDPYVKIYLLPDKSKGGKRKTKVKKHTLNPVFDETLKFHISLNGLETRTLWLTVWHSDMFGRNDFLGEVMMTLENKVFDDPTPKLYNLQERTEPFDDTISFKGDIIVCLKFVPPDMTVQKKGKRSRGTLHVLVKEAKYLTAYKANGTSDPFCKSYLLPDKGRNSKQKTPVIKKTVNPVWNYAFIYDDVTLQELAERCLELTVWDHDRLASNEFLGGVRFSLGNGKHYGKSVEWMDSTGKEVTLWKSMLERPNFWVEGCLSLRPTLETRMS